MEITVDTRAIAKIEADALVTYAFEQEKPVGGHACPARCGHGRRAREAGRVRRTDRQDAGDDAAVLPGGPGRAAPADSGSREEGKIRHGRTAQAGRDGGAHAEVAPGEEPGIPGARR